MITFDAITELRDRIGEMKVPIRREHVFVAIVAFTLLAPWITTVPTDQTQQEAIAATNAMTAAPVLAGSEAPAANTIAPPVTLPNSPTLAQSAPHTVVPPLLVPPPPSDMKSVGAGDNPSESINDISMLPAPPPAENSIIAPTLPASVSSQDGLVAPPPPMPARFTKLPASGREPIAAKLGLQQLVPQVARPDPSVPYNSETESDEPAEQIAQRGGPLEAPTPGEQVPAPTGDDSRFTGLPRDYKLGPGDQISVIDPSIGSLEAPSTSIHTLGPDGTVTIYPIGVVRAAGLSVPQLNDVVNQKASAFIRNPRISIALLKTRPITVYVLGDVLSPGLWSNGQSPATERERQQAQNLSIAQQGMGSITNMQRQSRLFGRTDPGSTQIPAVVSTATPTLVEPEPAVQALTALTAIQLAGGIKETADIRNITVRKQGGRVYTVDLWRLLALGDFEQDVMLQSGDVVYVPSGGPEFAADKLGMAANQFRYVRVWGEVRNPGLYMLTPKDDAFSIIARAGGFTDKANMRKVQLSRVRRDGSIQYLELPIKAALDGSEPNGRVKVMPGDVLIARPSYIKKMGPKLWETVAVAGGAILLLYLSRTIKDRSLPAGTNTTSVNLF